MWDATRTVRLSLLFGFHMYVRISNLQVRASRINDVIHALRMQAIPAFQAIPGCQDVRVLKLGDDRLVFMSEWDRQDQAVGATDAKYRVAALQRIEPDLVADPDTFVYEVVARG